MKNKMMFSVLAVSLLFSSTAYSEPQMKKVPLEPQAVKALGELPKKGLELQVVEKNVPDSEIVPVDRPFPCPNPAVLVEQTHSVQNTATPPYHNPADFPASWASLPLTGYGGTQANKFLVDTFTWKTKPCCQFVKGTLTIYYKPIERGHGDNSPKAGDAGNDSWGIWKKGVGTLLPTQLASGYLYSITTPPYNFSAGSGPYTKVINLTAAMVDCNQLSYYVQDDTSVIWAKINLSYCCVNEGCGK